MIVQLNIKLIDMNQKIKKHHEVQSSAANQHNQYLDADEVAELIRNVNPSNLILPFSILTSTLEWYVRTISDEIYKLSFLNQKKFNRAKIFWPSQYENQNDLILQYLNQFDGHDLEDYFDVIIKIQMTNEKALILNCFLNSFTFQVEEKERNNFSNQKGLELFYERKEVIMIGCENDLSALVDLTNLLCEKYIYQSHYQEQREIIKFSQQELYKRLIPILQEETLVVLYELYKDL
ncbi:unnamed protein product (macronuclear) [Paramecium tetraurelia]|uniref:Uncharacterized protein n=1 Tax=Paramecium tetraurelia TaxID=5888 RepID=A0C5I1_PARTE|nr:uncharacterized protein GSPATT00006547001 [Paramecium tetraurelia]CAK66048.1 unnamed protein product [Paramecium tetraurelia]|eukprot:XP_001433445.1 hypothetical protein (macronuclear) [Paramecium tetraurelia strain d4-2]